MFPFRTLMYHNNTDTLIKLFLIRTAMNRKEIQKFFIRKLRNFSPPKWGASHTEERNMYKGLPKHLIGRKETTGALEELYKMGFINRYKKTYEIHVSLNIDKKNEIEQFLES